MIIVGKEIKGKKKKKLEFYLLLDVDYVRIAPIIMSILYKKRNHWLDEDEWRVYSILTIVIIQMLFFPIPTYLNNQP